MVQPLHNLQQRKLPRPHRIGRHALVVRTWVAAVAWLSSELCWSDGRIVWQDERLGAFVPTPADLALAHGRLQKIARRPVAARQVLGDAEQWLTKQRQCLILAELLLDVHADNLPGLVQRARAHDTEAINQLCSLLVAEVLCTNSLPIVPSEALLACGSRALHPLLEMLDNNVVPSPVHALAALLIGVIERTGENRSYQSRSFTTAWLRRAYLWGLQTEPLPSYHNVLIAMLLADPDGATLCQRYRAALRTTNGFELPVSLLRELLYVGILPAQIVALVEAVQPLAARLALLGHELKSTQQHSEHNHRDLATLIQSYVRSTPEPAVVKSLGQLLEALLALDSYTPVIVDAIHYVLEQGLTLPPVLQGDFVALLNKQQASLWKPEALPPSRTPDALQHWFNQRWVWQVSPLLKLLKTTQDCVTVHEIHELGCAQELARYNWRETPLKPWVLTVIREFRLGVQSWKSDVLARTIHAFPTAEAAHAALRPLADALMSVDQDERGNVLYELLEALQSEPASARETLPRLTRYAALLAELAKQSKNPRVCGALVPGLLLLDRVHSEDAGQWLTWLGAHLAAQQSDSAVEYKALELGVLLSVILANNDVRRFQTLVHAAIRHDFEGNWRRWQQIKRGIEALQHMPMLHPPLAHMFPQQPRRSVELLVRLGLVLRLGDDVLGPLHQLVPLKRDEHELGDETDQANDAPVLPMLLQATDTDWHVLMAFVPELAPIAGNYLYAQWLRGGDFTMPAGVRKALDQPRKLKAELAHLERRLATQPERVDLAVRVSNLRTRLADQEPLLESIHAEVTERLAQITAEVQLAAVEHQLQACYRARLDIVAGPLPEHLVLDDDLLNATLLTVDIGKNRRLLRRLLRAHLAGDRYWREQMPANAAFLQQLTEQGIDHELWLGQHPRVYRYRHVAGERVRLHLERDPIRILQMGNYFDTCLSFGGVNSFSTVANACELNKRVIYAQDSTGRIVGRKLIAVSSEWKLVGFHTYTSLTNDEASGAVRKIFRRYVQTFAARVGLALADEGDVPALFAEDWYDDGVVDWNDDEEQPNKEQHAVNAEA